MDILKEDVDIPVDDGKINLKGSIYFSPNVAEKAPFIINMAGLLDHRESYFVKTYSERFAENGYYVLAYDYRAHGETAEQTGKNWLKMIKPIFSDINMVISWIIDHQSHRLLDDKIALFGRSLGGAIILTHGYADERVKVLISLCTRFDYAKYKIKFPEDVVKHMSAKYFLKEHPSNNSRVLIAHCKDDKRIPYENVLHIKRNLGLNDKNVISFETGGHSFREHREDAFIQSIDFLKHFL